MCSSDLFPHRLESEDYARPWFCPTLVIFIFYTWFPHRLESEDHTRPWFCPWAPVLNWAWAADLLGPKSRGYFRSLRSRGTFWRPSVRGVPSRGSPNPTAKDEVGN